MAASGDITLETVCPCMISQFDPINGLGCDESKRGDSIRLLYPGSNLG